MAHEAIQKAKALIPKKENVEKIKSLFARKTKTEEPEHKPVQVTKNLGAPKKSKLVMCIEILCTLVARGPMKITQFLDQFEIDKVRLEAHLRLLWDRGLIEEETFDDNQTYYLVTPRGKTVLKLVGPIIKEAHKIQIREYDAISNTLSDAGYK